MRLDNGEDTVERFRLGAGMGGVVMVTLILLLAQLQLDTASLLFA